MSKNDSQKDRIVLRSILSPERILFLKGKQTKNEVFDSLIQILCKEEEEAFTDDVKWGIYHREDLMNTAMGNGIAIPHTLLPDLEECRLAIALCPDSISDFQTPDGIPVRMVVMLLSPKEKGLLHLQVIEKIGSLFYDGRLKTAFLAAGSPANCMEILARAEE